MKNHQTNLSRMVQAIFILGLIGAAGVAHAGGLVAAWGDDTWGQTTQPEGVNNVKAIAAGWRHTLALKADGTVMAWGYDDGSGATIVPTGLTNIVGIAAGAGWNMTLKSDGTVFTWGGNGADFHVSGLSNVTAIAAGWYHWLALEPDGTIATWGIGSDSFNPANPTNIPPGLSNITAVAAGLEDSMVLKLDGTVVAWGWNEFGETNVPPGLSNVTAIAAGYYHNLALKADGTVAAWGADDSGQADVPPGLSNVVAIAAGAEHSLALKADGTVVAWGANGIYYPNFGQAAVPQGLSNVRAIAAGEGHSLALVFDGPIQIIQNPQSQGIPYTSNATFSVVASGASPISYQWFLGGSALSDNSRVSGSTNATLTISNLQFADMGDYTVLVSNAFGSVISTGAALTVISPPFITQPSSTNLTVRAGTNVTFSALAQGTPALSYQWWFNGTVLAGATNTTFSMSNVQPGASGDYSLIVTNLYGSTQADWLLTVTDSPPYILTQPAGQPATVGQNIAFSVLAKGSLPLTYQWRFNGANISGATNTALMLTNLNYSQTGYYDVAVSNPFGSVVSAKNLLNVTQSYLWGTINSSSPTNTPLGLSNLVAIAAGNDHVLCLKRDGTVATWAGSVSPASVTNVPSSVTNVMAIAANGNSSMALKSNGTVVVWGDNIAGMTNVPAAATNLVAIADGGAYGLALNSNGTIIQWGGAPKAPAGLSNVVGIAAGSSFGLALKNDGTLVSWGSAPVLPAPLTNVIAISANASTYLALRANGTVVGSGSQAGGVPSNLSNVVAIAAGMIPGAALKSDSTLVSWGFSVGNSNSFPASVSNVIAFAVSSSTPFIAAVVGDGSPFITLPPAGQTTTNGANVTLHVRAVGLPPLRYQWRFNGASLPRATNADLTLANVHGANTGAYQVVVTNGLGAVTSRTAPLTIPFSTNLASALNTTNLVWSSGSTNAPWFAEILVTHDGDTAAQSGAIGNSQQSRLQTTVTGPGTLTFWWKVSSEAGYDFLNFYEDTTNQPLANISGEVDWQQKSFAIGAGTHLLQWIYAKDVSVSVGQDAGWLDQVVFTPDPPVITQQPLGQTNWMGSNVTFQAAAGGAPVLNYQWLKNGTNVPNAQSAVLTLTNLTRRDSGAYAVQVSNAGGSVVSSNAALVVFVPQQLSAPGFLPDGSFSFISSDADGGQLLPGDVAGFEFQASTNLVDWVTLANAFTLTNGALMLRDLDAGNLPQRFYRVREH